MDNNTSLSNAVVSTFADYSQNIKKLSCKSGIALQFRDMPDISLLNLPCYVRQGAQIIRFDYHCISDDPKYDTCLWPSSLRQVVNDILCKFPTTVHFEVTTATSKREFKSVAVFKRIFDHIVLPLKKTVSLCNFGPYHGKFLYDGSGRIWSDRYAPKCVGELGIDANDLEKVAPLANPYFMHTRNCFVC